MIVMGNKCMGFNKEATISARIHISEKEKLKKSGYNTRQAVEYFNSVVTNRFEGLCIEEFFLNKEIEELKLDLIVKEMRLDEIQKEKDNLQMDNLSKLRVYSYKNMVAKFNYDNTNQDFETFLQGSYIQQLISEEVSMIPNCSFDEYVDGLINYHKNVILVSNTF